MNPLTNVKNINKLNETELQKGLVDKKSWHDLYKGSAWVFIGGLAYGLTEGDILAVFSQYGEIVNVNLVRDKKTGKTKGFCFLCYANQKSTILAVDNLNGIKLCGRTIRVDHVANYKPPKDNENDDELTKQLKTEGCAPKPIKIETSPVPAPATIQKKKKVKKEKKKHKKSKMEGDSEYHYKKVKVKKEKRDSGYDKYEVIQTMKKSVTKHKKNKDSEFSDDDSSSSSSDSDDQRSRFRSDKNVAKTYSRSESSSFERYQKEKYKKGDCTELNQPKDFEKNSNSRDQVQHQKIRSEKISERHLYTSSSDELSDVNNEKFKRKHEKKHKNYYKESQVATHSSKSRQSPDNYEKDHKRHCHGSSSDDDDLFHHQNSHRTKKSISEKHSRFNDSHSSHSKYQDENKRHRDFLDDKIAPSSRSHSHSRKRSYSKEREEYSKSNDDYKKHKKDRRDR